VCIVSYSQTDEFFNEFKGTFAKSIQTDIDKVVQEIKFSDEKFKEADQLFDSGDISKSLGISKKCSNVFETDYRELFMLFDGKITEMLKDIEGDKNVYCTRLLSEARNLFRLSISQRLSADNEKIDKTAYTLYSSAHENEVKAINSLSHNFAVISGKIVEDLSLKEEDVKLFSEQFDQSVTDDFVSRSFTVKAIDLPTNFSFNNQTDQINTDDSQTNTENGYQPDHITVHYNKIENGNKNSGTTLGHEFRIQIGTSILPANDWQLKQINPTNMEVNTFKSKIYYKYTVGSFPSFQEAKNYKNAYGLKATYIVEYNKGVEIKFYYGDVQ
jgi:hypothetical protein